MRRMTVRLREVAELVAEGLTNREIGERLGISPATVRNHLVGLGEAMGAGDTSTGNGRRSRVRIAVLWTMVYRDLP